MAQTLSQAVAEKAGAPNRSSEPSDYLKSAQGMIDAYHSGDKDAFQKHLRDHSSYVEFDAPDVGSIDHRM